MGCRIFFVRHGETKWNQIARLQGSSDIPLNNKGQQQAQAISDRLANLSFDGFFSSHLSRAKETANIIAAPHQQPVKEIKDLQELNFGVWEGLTMEQVRQDYADLSNQWFKEPLTTRIPKGETLTDLVQRATKSVQQIIQDYPKQQVVVVAHGGTIRSIVATVLGVDLNQYWRLRQDNAALTIIDFYGWDKAILMLYNDCSHLNPVFCHS